LQCPEHPEPGRPIATNGRVEEIRSRGRKGTLAAQRDAALLKTIYAFGLRRGEA
jgi:site-specific recombinase XerD